MQQRPLSEAIGGLMKLVFSKHPAIAQDDEAIKKLADEFTAKLTNNSPGDVKPSQVLDAANQNPQFMPQLLMELTDFLLEKKMQAVLNKYDPQRKGIENLSETDQMNLTKDLMNVVSNFLSDSPDNDNKNNLINDVLGLFLKRNSGDQAQSQTPSQSQTQGQPQAQAQPQQPSTPQAPQPKKRGSINLAPPRPAPTGGSTLIEDDAGDVLGAVPGLFAVKGVLHESDLFQKQFNNLLKNFFGVQGEACDSVNSAVHPLPGNRPSWAS